MALRRAGTCAVCGAELPAGATAWWDPGQRTVSCNRHGQPTPNSDGGRAEGAVDPPAIPLDRGTAGGSARLEYERRHARREARLEEKWGRLAGVAKFLSDDPQSTTAWAKGGKGEEGVGAKLEGLTASKAILLYDRCVPRTKGNIDIVAVAPSGVWVIDVKNYSGRVERRDVGGFFRTDVRLYAGGRDRSKAADQLGWQLMAVTNALGHVHIAAEVHAVLCFYKAEWSLFAKPFQHAGVWVTWPSRLAEMLNAPGPLDEPTVRTIAHHVATALPSKA